ncbi:MAG: hypothetical protein IKE25_10800, partial [Clostridia bacterium]|nr:hypothetical protein [Clostridia bacterium]
TNPASKKELSATEKVEKSPIMLYNRSGMQTIIQGEYISIQKGCHQLKQEIICGREYKAEKDEQPVRRNLGQAGR